MRYVYRLFCLFWGLGLVACTSEAVNRDRMVNISQVAHRTELRLADLNIAIQRDRDNAALYAKRAFLFLEAKNIEKALTDINQALELDDEQEEFYFRRAVILRGAGQLKNALAAAEEAENRGYKLPDVYLLQSELLLKLNRYNETLEKVNIALQESPKNEYALYYKGLAQAARADTASAIEYFYKALKAEPEFSDAYLQLIAIFNGQKLYDQAQYYINLAEKRNNSNGYLWYQKGLRYNGLYFPDSAYVSLIKAVKFAPDLYPAHYQLALLNHKKGQFAAAATYMEKVKAAKANLPRVTEVLAESYEKSGRYKEAIVLYSELLRQKPNDVWASWGVRRSNYALYKISRDSIQNARQQARYEQENENF